MQIKGAVIGSVATVAVIAGGFVAIAAANADNAVPQVTPSATVATVDATPTPTPVVTVTVTPTPTPEAVVTVTPEPTVAAPAPAPAAAPAPTAAPAPAPTLVQGTAPPANSGSVVVQPGTVMPPHPPGTFYVPPDN